MRIVAITILFLVGAGCAGTEKKNSPEANLSLVAVSPDIAPFFIRQRVEISYGEDTHLLDAVIEFDGTTVRTVFLDPASRPAIVMEQAGNEFKAFGPKVDALPFDPRWIMQVIGSALLMSPLHQLGFEQEVRPSALGVVRDTAVDGRLTTRFVESHHTQIEYSWDGHACPTSIKIENSKQLYSLNITTLQCGEDLNE